MAGKPENLKPKTSASARGRLGAIKTNAIKREKKLLSQIYADILADQSGIKKGKGLRAVVEEILNGKSAGNKVKLLKEIREATEGSKVQMTGADGAPLIPQAVVFKVVDAHDSRGGDCETVPGDS